MSPSRKPKVLLVSLFHPEIVRGGAQQICYELFEGLRAEGETDVTLLAAIDETTPSFYKSGARITGFDARPGEFLFLSRDYDYTWHRNPNPILIESFAVFLETIRPDVVHFHHFLLLGLDLLSLTRRVLPKARIILTFHEFLSICAADGQMVRKLDGSLCTRVSDVRCHQCFPHVSPEHFFMKRQWTARHLGVVDHFTTPSRFMIEPFVDWGLDRARITHIPNGQADRSRPMPPRPKGPANRFGFFGQMVDAKGIHVLLEAVTLLRAEGFEDFIVEINGGNLRFASEKRRAEIEAFQAEEEARDPADRRVIFNGSYHPDDLHRRMARIDWCLVPSVWWEIFGLVISEAWNFRRPVIVSDVGGPAERVTHGQNGLVFPMGDARALAATIHRACTEQGLWETLSDGITPPPARAKMVDAFLTLYGSPA